MIALDTDYWVWFHTGDDRLSAMVARAMGRDTIVSAASIWEVMVLIAMGQLKIRSDVGLPRLRCVSPNRQRDRHSVKNSSVCP